MVVQKLFKCNLIGLRAVYARDLQQVRGLSVPIQLPFLHEHGNHGGEHRFGIGTYVKAVLDAHVARLSGSANASRTPGDDRNLTAHDSNKPGDS